MKELSEPSDEDLAQIASDLAGILDGPEPDATKPGYKEDPYPDWNKENTYVISGPLGKANFSGTRYQTWQEARIATCDRFPVVQFWVYGQRWFSRVRKHTGDL